MSYWDKNLISKSAKWKTLLILSLFLSMITSSCRDDDDNNRDDAPKRLRIKQIDEYNDSQHISQTKFFYSVDKLTKAQTYYPMEDLVYEDRVSYDKNGNPKVHIDPLGLERHYSYEENQIIITEPNNPEKEDYREILTINTQGQLEEAWIGQNPGGSLLRYFWQDDFLVRVDKGTHNDEEVISWKENKVQERSSIRDPHWGLLSKDFQFLRLNHRVTQPGSKYFPNLEREGEFSTRIAELQEEQGYPTLLVLELSNVTFIETGERKSVETRFLYKYEKY